MAPFMILDDQLEDELHAKRLLRVEERPLERIKNRLLGPTTPINTFLARTSVSSAPPQPTSADESAPEDEPATATTATSEEHVKFLKDLQRFKEDVVLDFAAFEASIARIQFLRDANEKERQRYAAEKLRIEATAQDVRDDTARLKVRLDEAKNTLEVRKGYDVLAEKITNDVRLKPRDEQHVNIERLKVEIEEQEREGVELRNAWIERREQLNRVLEEGKRLRRVVRDEKEPEPDEKGDGEGEAEDDGEEDENMLGVEGQRGEGSNMGTPLPIDDDAPTPLPGVHESGAMTPRSMLADAEVLTPRPDTSANEAMQDADMQETEAAEQTEIAPKAKTGDEMDVS